jgi:hypothetical protein
MKALTHARQSLHYYVAQALVRQVLAFADMGESDDSEPEQENDASMGYSEFHGATAAAPPPIVPPPANLRPIRVAPRPEAAVKQQHRPSFTPTVRGKHAEGDSTPDRVSPTSVLPPPRPAGLGAQASTMYTYFDKDAGTLVTASVPQAQPAPVLVLPPGVDSDEEEDWDAPDRSFVAQPQPLVPPVVVTAAIVPPPMPPPECVAPVRRAPKAVPRKRRGGGGAFKLLLTSAVGVGLALFGKEQLVAGVISAQRMLRGRLEAAHRARTVADAADAKRAAVAARRALRSSAAQAVVAAEEDAAECSTSPVAAAPPPLVAAPVGNADTSVLDAAGLQAVATEWQPRSAMRLPGAPPPSEAPDAWHPAAMRTREVRWQPHVSLGRG